jgi:ATP-binding cassette, subfamily B, bacterial
MLAARLAGMLQESLGATRTVRAFGAEAREVARLDAVNRKLLATDRYIGARRSLVTPLWHFAEAFGVIAVLWYGGQLLGSKAITIGAMVGFMAYMELLAGPINRIGGYYSQFQSSHGIATRIIGLLAGAPAKNLSGTQCGSGNGIEVSGVGFRYPRGERWILRDVSFSVKPGECVALAGRNGAGKSTLIDLVLEFYVPTEGRIVVGGVDLADWEPSAWRKTLGYMPQETVLFRGTLAENVAFGRPDADRSEIARALEDAGGAVLVKRLPRGLDTVVGERGLGLSGGERQLIGLARLFLHDPQVVLLDEPTSNLDGETLRIVNAALARLAQGRTVLLITHVAETLKIASRIVLLDGGSVVAAGTADELYATQPLFRSLVGVRSPQHPQRRLLRHRPIRGGAASP